MEHHFKNLPWLRVDFDRHAPPPPPRKKMHQKDWYQRRHVANLTFFIDVPWKNNAKNIINI